MNLALLTGPLAQAIGWALLHLLWQGTLVATLLAVALALLAGRGANLRYAVSCAALALIVALGIATAVRSYPGAAAGPTLGHAAVRPLAATAATPTLPDRLRAFARAANDALPQVVTLWFAGVALFSVRLILEWLRARRLVTRNATRARQDWQTAARRLSTALGVRQAVRLLESAAVEIPSVIGILSPAILLPASTLTGLTPSQIEMILAHELAHIRRHDFLVNLMQAATETLLFYHPAVWWISRRIRIERENCCDDLAVAVCGNPIQYARALTRLEELRATPALAASAGGGSLVERIRRIAGGSTRATGPAVRGAVALGVLSCVLLAVAAPTFPAIGQWEPVMKHGHPDGGAGTAARRVITDDSGAPGPGTFAAIVPGSPSADRGSRAGEADTSSSELDTTSPDDSESAAEPTPDASDHAPHRLSLDDIIELRTQDVTPAMIREMRSLFSGIELREIAQMSAVGATPAFIRDIRGAGLDVRTARDAEGLAALGVTPEFIRDMRSAGLAVESARDAQSLAAVGVTSEFVRGLRAEGFAIRSAQEAQSLAAVGVTPDYVRSLRDAGVALGNASEAQSLRALGVTPEFVKRLAQAGYRHLTVEQLDRLGASGVTGDLIRELSRYRSP